MTRLRLTWTSLGFHVVAVPHGRLVSGPIADFALDAAKRNILVTHGLAPTLAESPRHELGEVTLDQGLLSPKYDAILLGHFHEHAKISSNTWYAGSTERIGWNDEAHNPCWSVVTVSDEGAVEAYDRRIAARQMITLGAYDGTGQSAREISAGVLEAATRFANPDAMVRIELTNVERRERRSAEAMVRRESANQFLVLQMFSRLDNSALFNEEVRVDDSLKMKGLADLFSDFVGEQEYDDGFRARFLERGRAAIQDAIQSADMALAEPE